MADINNKYVLEGSHGEVARLQKQHLWFQSSLNGQIVFAPLELQQAGLRVLDIGCADGTLLRDLQQSVSHDAELIGLDVSESFLPKSAQGNIRYVVGDLNEPFSEELNDYFDLTHLRYTLVGASKLSVEKAVANLTSTLKPGGWLQVQEPDLSLKTWEHQSSALADFVTILGAVLDKVGIGHGFSVSLDDAFRKAGLENVSVKEVKYPIGAKTANPEAARSSIETFLTTVETAVGSVKALNVDIPPAVMENLAKRFETEMSENGGEYRGVIVIGQKKAAS
ncbi:S-adenosyl-L-methionine-dependent methyltransferase [Sarocladium strictum]